MIDKKSKWLIAFLPPPKIGSEILGFQKELEQHFGTVHAQKAPPHITVVPPFDADDYSISKLIRTFNKMEPPKPPFSVCLDGFQHFGQRTLFVDVAKNERFENFCKEIKKQFDKLKITAQRKEKHFFVPHITIANKDLKKRNFQTAFQLFGEREYRRNFLAERLSLLQLTAGKWKVIEDHLLK